MYKLENPLMWEHQSKNKCAKNRRKIAKQTQLQEITICNSNYVSITQTVNNY